MRKVTYATMAAFIAGRKMLNGNTTVQREMLPEGEAYTVRLHGNLIAKRYTSEPGVMYATMAGWGSATTRERLGGVLPAGLGIGQRNYGQEWRANGTAFGRGWLAYAGKPVDTRAMYRVDANQNTISLEA